MVESVLRRRARDTETRPDKGFGVKDSDVVQVALLEGSADSTNVLLHVLIVEVEATMNDKVSSDQD